MEKHNFTKKMTQSHKEDNRIQSHLSNYFVDCEKVTVSKKFADEIQGIDFKVHLKSGKELNVDLKSRIKGSSKYWKNNEPEVALEIWSIKKGSYYYFTTLEEERSQVGWSVANKETDFILYSFFTGDCESIFIFSFELLKNALKKNGRKWMKEFKSAEQITFAGGNRWVSQVLFLPISVLRDAIY